MNVISLFLCFLGSLSIVTALDNKNPLHKRVKNDPTELRNPKNIIPGRPSKNFIHKRVKNYPIELGNQKSIVSARASQNSFHNRVDDKPTQFRNPKGIDTAKASKNSIRKHEKNNPTQIRNPKNIVPGRASKDSIHKRAKNYPTAVRSKKKTARRGLPGIIAEILLPSLIEKIVLKNKQNISYSRNPLKDHSDKTALKYRNDDRDLEFGSVESVESFEITDGNDRDIEKFNDILVQSLKGKGDLKKSIISKTIGTIIENGVGRIVNDAYDGMKKIGSKFIPLKENKPYSRKPSEYSPDLGYTDGYSQDLDGDFEKENEVKKLYAAIIGKAIIHAGKKAAPYVAGYVTSRVDDIIDYGKTTFNKFTGKKRLSNNVKPFVDYPLPTHGQWHTKADNLGNTAGNSQGHDGEFEKINHALKLWAGIVGRAALIALPHILPSPSEIINYGKKGIKAVGNSYKTIKDKFGKYKLSNNVKPFEDYPRQAPQEDKHLIYGNADNLGITDTRVLYSSFRRMNDILSSPNREVERLKSKKKPKIENIMDILEHIALNKDGSKNRKTNNIKNIIVILKQNGQKEDDSRNKKIIEKRNSNVGHIIDILKEGIFNAKPRVETLDEKSKRIQDLLNTQVPVNAKPREADTSNEIALKVKQFLSNLPIRSQEISLDQKTKYIEDFLNNKITVFSDGNFLNYVNKNNQIGTVHNSINEEENNANEIIDEYSSEDSESEDESPDYRRKSKKKKKKKRKHRGRDSKYTSKESVDSDISASSDYERNPGNPFTIHRNKYKQNWLWNHFMDGDHMNINPFGPPFANMGPSGADLFFGRKWWYYNQDDYKPMG